MNAGIAGYWIDLLSRKLIMTISPIISPRAFPFKVLLSQPPLLSMGANVHVLITTALSQISQQIAKEFDGFMDAFFMLASSGGLSGDLIAPQDSSIAEKSEVITQQNILKWGFIECCIDEHAVFNLLNLVNIIHTIYPVISVAISTSSSSSLYPLVIQQGIDDYYPRLAKPPFMLKINDPISESILLTLLFEEPPTTEEVGEIESELLSWSVAPTVGAFAVPETDPEICTMNPEQCVEAFDNEITWNIDKFRMHPAAIDSLINCCIAISYRITNIKKVEIS